MQTQKSKIDTGKALDNDLVIIERSGTESELQGDNSRSWNDTDANDADIRPIYDEMPMVEVQLTAECYIFAIGKQHTEQPEIINEGRADQWKPTGRFFKYVGLRWIPTGKLFNSCTSKDDGKPTHGLNVDIPNTHESKQTLDLSAVRRIELSEYDVCSEKKIRHLDYGIQYAVLGRRFDMSYPTGGYGVSDFADHAGNAAGSVYDAAAEFSMMGISPKLGLGFKECIVLDEVFDLSTPSVFDPEIENREVKSLYESDKSSESETYDFASCVSSPKTNDSFSTVDVKISPKNFPSVVLNATSVPAGSRNSSTSISAGRSISAASRNRPASIHADRHIPASIIDSGCSRSMTGNKEKLDDFVQVKGGTITFGGGDGKITGKGTIRNFKLNFENVYYVEELQHFNLFSVSKICDKKNKVLFTDDECLVLTKEFQLPDESQVLLRIPRRHDLYTFNLSDIQPEQHIN
nr:ribonuclease H-like domain-containing protein [Tanacetum cinerariifolium]